MSEVSRNIRVPMERSDRFLGQIIEMCVRAGDLSVCFFTRKYRRLPEQIVCHIRVRVSKDNEVYAIAHPLRTQLTALMMLLEFNIYEEKDFNYIDFKIRAL